MFARLSADEKRVIFLSSLGGALEFYDFIIYLFFASTLSQLFFPSTNHLAALMGVFAVFAIGYLIRPLGGILFSHFGDKYGRKASFVMTLILMALPTFLIGLLPTTESIGTWAAGFLVLLRVLQGLSVGGEIPGAITFAGEHVSRYHRGFACAIIFFGINFGLLLGSFVSVLLTSTLTAEQILTWGWRIPFILGGILGLVSFQLRKRMTETPIFNNYLTELHRESLPVVELFKKYFPRVLIGIALTCGGAVVVCLLLLYLPTYLTSILHYPKPLIDKLNTINILFFSVVASVAGWLSDKIGRRPILLTGTSLFFLFGYGLFYLLTLNHIGYVIFVMGMFALFGGCLTGTFPCALIELFPTRVRFTGMAVSYNIGFAFFGGLAPLVATYIIKVTDNLLAPSFYLMFSVILCGFAAWCLRDNFNSSLDDVD